MIRMTTVSESEGEVTLRVEGQIVSQWVPVLERETMRFVEKDRRVLLDLREVKFVDSRGVEMLRGLVRENVEIVDAPPLIKDLLEKGEKP